MNAYLRALRTDPRFAACLAAILLLLVDDVPQRAYGTFRDPGCALLLSITYGNCAGLIVARKDVQASTRRMFAGLLFACLPVKDFVQSVLYIRNADVIDTVLLLAAHACIAAAASRDVRRWSIFIRVAASSTVLILATFLLSVEYAYSAAHKLGFEPNFFTYAAARAVVPYTFWTVVLTVSRVKPLRAD